MKNTKHFITAVIAIVAGFALIGLGILVSPNSTSTQDKINNCLYASESAYPNWDGPGLLLDNLSACKGLSEASKAQLRELTKSFAEAYMTGK